MFKQKLHILMRSVFCRPLPSLWTAVHFRCVKKESRTPRSEVYVFAAMNIQVTPYHITTRCHNLKMEAVRSSETRSYPTTSLHGVTTLKNSTSNWNNQFVFMSLDSSGQDSETVMILHTYSSHYRDTNCNSRYVANNYSSHYRTNTYSSRCL